MKGIMKGMVLIMLVGIFFLAAIVFSKADGAWFKAEDGGNFKRLKTTKTYQYGPRGKISTVTGIELFPAYPSSLPGIHTDTVG